MVENWLVHDSMLPERAKRSPWLVLPTVVEFDFSAFLSSSKYKVDPSLYKISKESDCTLRE